MFEKLGGATWSHQQVMFQYVSTDFSFAPCPEKFWVGLERGHLYQRRGHEHISVLISMLPPQASKLVCFSSNDKCNHHSFFYSEKFSLCYVFSKTDKLFAFFVTLLPNRNEYSQIIPREDSQSTVIIDWRCRIPSLRLLVSNHS